MKDTVNERYLRQQMVDWLDQGKLSKYSVVVVGAGATGNEVLKNLSLMGVGNIHIIDFDTIESHNLTRTILFRENDVGRFKADAAAEACRQIDPNISVTYSTGDLWKMLTIGKLKTYDAVFCCTDNFEARVKLNELCIIAGTDLYNTAIDSRYAVAEQYPFRANHNCACYECNLPDSVYQGIKERYSCGGLKKSAYEMQKVPTTAIAASIAAATACGWFLSGYPEGAQELSRHSHVDTVTMDSSLYTIPHNMECPACATWKGPWHHFVVNNHGAKDALSIPMQTGDLNVLLSDKVATEVHCTKCGKRTMLLEAVDKYDDTLVYCPGCELFSREVKIKDAFSINELENLFTGRRIPTKFIHFDLGSEKFILETEE